jgi:hypothetical protein
VPPRSIARNDPLAPIYVWLAHLSDSVAKLESAPQENLSGSLLGKATGTQYQLRIVPSGDGNVVRFRKRQVIRLSIGGGGAIAN